MKRLKLFEAFSNCNKIEKVNFLLFNWAVKEFIAEEDLKFKMLSLPNKYDVFFIQKVKDFSSDYFKCEVALHGEAIKTIINIYCHFELGQFFVGKHIISTYDYFVINYIKEVIKKIYQDEKNKAI